MCACGREPRLVNPSNPEPRLSTPTLPSPSPQVLMNLLVGVICTSVAQVGGREGGGQDGWVKAR